MLPFMHPKKMSAVIIARRKPDGGTEPMHEEGEASPELMSAAESLCSAVAMKDAKGVASALQAAYDAMQMLPPDLGPEE